MENKNKYRLGNQPEEYELRTDYLDWLPKVTNDWFEFLHPSSDINFNERGKEVILISPEKEEITLLINCGISKDAFPSSFYCEERANNWHAFCIVSIKNSEEKFIIPVY